jgi:hypothetical protein
VLSRRLVSSYREDFFFLRRERLINIVNHMIGRFLDFT